MRLWKTLYGTEPSNVELTFWTGELANGNHTEASLGLLAADLDANAANINLVGLMQTGLEYVY